MTVIQRPQAVDLATRLAAARVVAGVLLLGSMMLPLSRRGPASAIAIRELADMALAGHVATILPRWIGIACYSVPMAGAVLLALAASDTGWAHAARTAAIGLVATIAMLSIVSLGLAPGRMGTGLILIAAAVATASVAELARRERR